MTDVPETVRRALRRGVSARGIVAGAVLASAAGIAAAETFKLPVETSAPGLMVLQRHGKAHVSRRPGDGPSVVFENGLCTPLTSWSWILQDLPEEQPFLAYDRPGVGWSHSAPAQWRQRYPADLYELLGLMNVHPPLILVGHSIGGLLIRMFADRYPELVGGLVFVDPSPPGQYKRSPGAQQGLEDLRNEMSRLTTRSALRLPPPAAWTTPMRSLPEALVKPSIRAMGRHGMLRAAQREVDLSATKWSQDAALLTSTPHPVAVVTSGGIHRSDPGYARLMDEIEGLSDISHTQVVDEADHMSLLHDSTHAARVTDAIRWAIDKCQGTPSPDNVPSMSTTTESTSCEVES